MTESTAWASTHGQRTYRDPGWGRLRPLQTLRLFPLHYTAFLSYCLGDVQGFFSREAIIQPHGSHRNSIQSPAHTSGTVSYT